MDGKTTAPVLPNLPAYIECQVEQIVETDGDHAVVILRVVEAECRERVRPLTIAESPWEYGGWPRGLGPDSVPVKRCTVRLFGLEGVVESPKGLPCLEGRGPPGGQIG